MARNCFQIAKSERFGYNSLLQQQGVQKRLKNVALFLKQKQLNRHPFFAKTLRLIFPDLPIDS